MCRCGCSSELHKFGTICSVAKKNPGSSKPNPVGFVFSFGGFLGLNSGFLERPNLVGAGISMGFQLLE